MAAKRHIASERFDKWWADEDPSNLLPADDRAEAEHAFFAGHAAALSDHHGPEDGKLFLSLNLTDGQAGVVFHAIASKAGSNPEASLAEICVDRIELLAACELAADLLLRCDGEQMPSDLKPATDEEWDAVVARLREVLAQAKGRA